MYSKMPTEFFFCYSDCLLYLERTKMIRLYRKNYSITCFENKFVFKDVLCPHLKWHDYNDYTKLLSYLSPIDFDMVHL